MKEKLFISVLSLMFVGLFVVNVNAQFDNLYYDPSDNTSTYPFYDDETSFDDRYYEDEYEDEYDNDYYDDYSYTRRIQRFHRPARYIDYYSVVYNDFGWGGFNDPFFNPYFGGTNVMISFGNPWGWNRWNRWNRWNNWGWNNWGWNAGFGWNSGFGWNAGFGWNNWGWNRWNRWNNWGWNNPYCPPGGGPWFGNNVVVVNNNFNDNNANGRYYGSRRNGSVSSSTNGRTASPRRLTDRGTENGTVSNINPRGVDQTTNRIDRSATGTDRVLRGDRPNITSNNVDRGIASNDRLDRDRPSRGTFATPGRNSERLGQGYSRDRNESIYSRRSTRSYQSPSSRSNRSSIYNNRSRSTRNYDYNRSSRNGSSRSTINRSSPRRNSSGFNRSSSRSSTRSSGTRSSSRSSSSRGGSSRRGGRG